MKILSVGDKILKKKAGNVPVEELTSGRFKTLVLEMQETLARCPDGVALAAPQVGESICLFIVSPKVFAEEKDQGAEAGGKGPALEPPPIADRPPSGGHGRLKTNLVYFNPKILRLSSKKQNLEEGCLSVNGLYGKVRRSEKATIEAYDEGGKKFERGASGLLAQIFQHEIDHLDGILYVDKALEMKKLENRQTDA